ncbi:hypothetical protein BJ912DRAFT_7297 [Pholiota molesta]|nr:hypothetical protein BJ912DRAFT_7297 [Pholiota molesta]
MDSASTALFSGFCLDIGVMGISQSAAHQNKIAAARILRRRPPRSTSSCTAPEVQEEDALQKKDGQSVPKRRQQPKRRSAARLKKERPLSADPMNCAKQPARRGRKAGSKTLTRKAPPSSEDRVPCKGPPTLHTCPYVTDYVGGSECPPAADVLLLRARESVQMQTDWAGRRPCVMDVVLDLQDRARGSRMPEARVAAYAVAAVRCNYGQCRGPHISRPPPAALQVARPGNGGIIHLATRRA